MALRTPTTWLYRSTQCLRKPRSISMSLRSITTYYNPIQYQHQHQHQHQASKQCLSQRTFGTSARLRGLMPETSDPPPREAEEHDSPDRPSEISTEDYHLQADTFLENLMGRLESRQEEKGDIDAEYSAGILSVETKAGHSYVLNKQPPNKQIWLSSPVSGPKRFDWVVCGESMNEKEGAGQGEWVYLRDGSRLTDLLNKELAINVEVIDGLGDKEVLSKGGDVQSVVGKQ